MLYYKNFIFSYFEFLKKNSEIKNYSFKSNKNYFFLEINNFLYKNENNKLENIVFMKKKFFKFI